MKNERHFETTMTGGKYEAQRLAILLADIHHTVRNLELSIEAEQDRARNHDPSHYAYPLTARMMIMRRNNLKATVAALEQRIEDTSPALVLA